ncbi:MULTISPECIES: hypothetical protein [unclassified Synechococcus]|uniref:hypothetical protein n=1 Tax=unclassified Synechococcus TaxID=2626047 RepID=UPI0012E8398D|nr:MULTISPECIES: hypothetical protein [unclassified Synechococcus]
MPVPIHVVFRPLLMERTSKSSAMSIQGLNDIFSSEARHRSGVRDLFQVSLP